MDSLFLLFLCFGAVLKSSAQDCKFTVGNQIFDLSGLYKSNGSYTTTSAQYTFNMNVCGVVQSPACYEKQGLLCQYEGSKWVATLAAWGKSTSGTGAPVPAYGTWGLIDPKDASVGVYLNYSNGDSCYMSGRFMDRIAVTKFYCSPGSGIPKTFVLIESPACVFTTTMETELACPSAAAYCNAGPLESQDTTLGPVYLQGDTATINELSSCPGVTGVQDFTKQEADLTIGSHYTLRYSVETCGDRYPLLSSAWIDSNRNLKFEDSERIAVYDTNYGLNSVSFKVPPYVNGVAITAGPTRLRVQVQETVSSTIDPCALFTYGGTKDFTVNLKLGY